MAFFAGTTKNKYSFLTRKGLVLVSQTPQVAVLYYYTFMLEQSYVRTNAFFM